MSCNQKGIVLRSSVFWKLTFWRGGEAKPKLNLRLLCKNVKVRQGYTNPWCQVALAPKFCTMAPNICGSSLWNFVRVTRLTPWTLKRLLGVLENLYTLEIRHIFKGFGTLKLWLWILVDNPVTVWCLKLTWCQVTAFNLLNPTGHVMQQQFNIQQLYVLPTLYLYVLYLSENK